MIAQISGLVVEARRERGRGVLAVQPDGCGLALEINVVEPLAAFEKARIDGAIAQGCTRLRVITTYSAEQGYRFFGFLQEEQRQAFRVLTDIDKVGPAVAMAILSALTPAELARAVRAKAPRDIASRCSGVGNKLAERICADAAGRFDVFLPAEIVDTPPPPEPVEPPVSASVLEAEADVASALTNLGFKKTEATAAARRVRNLLSEGSSVAAAVAAALRTCGRAIGGRRHGAEVRR